MVVSTVSFHHWGNQSKGLDEVHRVLRSGGSFILVDIIAASWTRPFFAVFRNRDRFHTLVEIDEMMHRAGMPVVERSTVPDAWKTVVATVARPTEP